MKYCDKIFGFKEVLEGALNLNDKKLRKLITNLVADLNHVFEQVECSEEDLDIEKKDISNYFS
ncbi:hypothetical protein LCGC14_0619060 [marine sediment metagenome]|uniref:Uncharacterized protein n=1 Tax=marine sediment metagenome TaxID=412755 RepID=A0A0F9TRU0_9ZZZZ